RKVQCRPYEGCCPAGPQGRTAPGGTYLREPYDSRAQSPEPSIFTYATSGQSCADGVSTSTGRWAGGLAEPVGLPSRFGSVAMPTAAPPIQTINATVNQRRAGPGTD